MGVIEEITVVTMEMHCGKPTSGIFDGHGSTFKVTIKEFV